MFPEICRNAWNAEALNVAIAAHDLEAEAKSRRAASQHTVLDRLCLAAALSHQKPNSSGSAPRRGSFERASSALGISGMEARRVDPSAWVLFFRGGVGHVLRRCLKV